MFFTILFIYFIYYFIIICTPRGRGRDSIVPVKRKDLFRLLGLNDPLDSLDPVEVMYLYCWPAQPGDPSKIRVGSVIVFSVCSPF